MSRIRAYHRPASIDDAIALLERPDVRTLPLGGGTILNGSAAASVDDVVDLQSLGLDAIRRDEGLVAMGAMARLQTVVDHELIPPLLKDLARGEAPSTIRNAATLGGTVAAADWESRLLAGLIAFEAQVEITSADGMRRVAVTDLLADPTSLEGAIITAVLIDPRGVGAAHWTARTPADTPIVLVAGRRDEDGGLVLAATGVGATPHVLDLASIDALTPPADFRGSSEYRRHLAAVLGARVVDDLAGGSAQ